MEELTPAMVYAKYVNTTPEEFVMGYLSWEEAVEEVLSAWIESGATLIELAKELILQYLTEYSWEPSKF